MRCAHFVLKKREVLHFGGKFAARNESAKLTVDVSIIKQECMFYWLQNTKAQHSKSLHLCSICVLRTTGILKVALDQPKVDEVIEFLLL